MKKCICFWGKDCPHKSNCKYSKSNGGNCSADAEDWANYETGPS